MTGGRLSGGWFNYCRFRIGSGARCGNGLSGGRLGRGCVGAGGGRWNFGERLGRFMGRGGGVRSFGGGGGMECGIHDNLAIETEVDGADAADGAPPLTDLIKKS